MKQISGVSEIADHYEIFLFDQFGVLHNGATVLGEADKVVKELKYRGKKLYIVSNYGCGKDRGMERCEKIGFLNSDFEDFICSGELCRNYMLDNFSRPEDKCLWIGYAPDKRELN